jgi:hypothetical protein
MKNKKYHKIILLVISLIAVCFHSILISTSNWKSSGSNTTEEDKQLINFYGTLTTHQGQKDAVAHILIEGKHKDIVMYDAPIKHEKEVFNQKTKQNEIKLDENPITDFMHTKIDLNTITMIKVPNPNIVWVYQKEKRYQRMEFVLLEIISKENSIPKKYLLERKTHISCNALDNGSQKKEVPLSAIDTLTIEGYSFTLNSKQSQENLPVPCPKKVTLSEIETKESSIT